MPVVLPPDQGLPGSNDVKDTATIQLRVDRETTRSLLTDAVSNWRLQPQELLLAAFAMTVAEWAGRPDLVVDVESHGREPVSPELDALRTVGWLASLYPVHLALPATADDGDCLNAVKSRLRGIPNGGVAYGALRYLGDSPDIRAVLESQPPSPLLFNYLGQWRRSTSPDAWLTFARPVMASTGCNGPRRYVFEINAAVYDGELRVGWTYGTKYHRRQIARALAERFLERVGALTALCASGTDDAPVPENFPDADLNESELEEILAEFGEN